MPHPWRPRQGSPGRSLPHRPRHARYDGRDQPSPEPLQVRREAPEVRTRQMPRKGEVPKRDVLPDPKYTDAPIDVRKRVTKFMNIVMTRRQEVDRRRHRLRRVRSRRRARQGGAAQGVRAALDNVKPKLEVKCRRVGGSTYQVPVDVRPERSQALGMRWLVDLLARSRREDDGREARRRDPRRRAKPRQRGKKREDTHKMAEANKAFAHYRW